MRGLGIVLLTGAGTIIVWKILAAFLVGLMGWALKVGFVILLVYVLMRMFNGRKKKSETAA